MECIDCMGGYEACTLKMLQAIHIKAEAIGTMQEYGIASRCGDKHGQCSYTTLQDKIAFMKIIQNYTRSMSNYYGDCAASSKLYCWWYERIKIASIMGFLCQQSCIIAIPSLQINWRQLASKSLLQLAIVLHYGWIATHTQLHNLYINLHY